MPWIPDLPDFSSAALFVDHRCDFPHDDLPLPELLPMLWECDSCAAVWSADVDQSWGGFWSPDSSDATKGTDKHGYPVLYCKREVYHVYSPSICFTYVAGGIQGVKYSSGVSMSYPHIPAPEGMMDLDGRERPYESQASRERRLAEARKTKDSMVVEEKPKARRWFSR